MKLKYFVTIFIIVHTITAAKLLYNNEDIPDTLTKEFNKKVNTWLEAYNSGDANNLIPLYTENAEYISGHVKGLVAQGRDNVIKNFQNGISSGGHIDKIEILSIKYSCDLAVLICLNEVTNKRQKAIGRNMLVLRKINDNWLIESHLTVV
ncbi:MAG: nuclear transport factor 2 family protein [Ignavibacteriales bacterium]|nr:nuclear transport factor 2 family protein [Ignavibacteriales bacterium]